MASLISKGLVLGGSRMSRSPHLLTRILKVYIEDFLLNPWGSVMYSVRMVSTIPSSLKVMSLKQLRVCKWWKEHTFQGQRKGWGASDCPDTALWSIGSDILWMNSSNSNQNNVLFSEFNILPFLTLSSITYILVLYTSK